MEREAEREFFPQSPSDESEKEYLLEYYSLVREGKTNYLARKMDFHQCS